MTSFFLKRVEKHSPDSDGSVLGYLVGNVSQNKVHITGCVACRSSTESSNTEYPGIPNWEIEYEELASTIPTGTVVMEEPGRGYDGGYGVCIFYGWLASLFMKVHCILLQRVQLCSCEPK